MKARSAPIFLVGFMGAGKSVVGRALAERLGLRFADTDEAVERTAGRSIEEIFRDSGEGRFREMEWDALRAIAVHEGTVIATGGGLFLGAAQREIVRRNGVSIWLDAPYAAIVARLGAGDARPVWHDADPVTRRQMFERRRAAYALADRTIDAGRGSAIEVAGRAESAWRSLCR